MNCQYCGALIPPNATFCPSCGANSATPNNAVPPPPPAYSAPVRQIPNHLVGAILVTLFCCLPFGIVSIVYASSVNGKLAAGDIPGAQQAADKAKTWMWLAFGLGLAANILLIFARVAAEM